MGGVFKDTGLKQHRPFTHSSGDQESNMKVSPAPSAQGGPGKYSHGVPLCLDMNVSHRVREDQPPQLGGLRSGPAGSTQHPRAPAGTRALHLSLSAQHALQGAAVPHYMQSV